MKRASHDCLLKSGCQVPTTRDSLLRNAQGGDPRQRGGGVRGHFETLFWIVLSCRVLVGIVCRWLFVGNPPGILLSYSPAFHNSANPRTGKATQPPLQFGCLPNSSPKYPT